MLNNSKVELQIDGRKWDFSTDYRLFVKYCNIATGNGDIIGFLRENHLPINEHSIKALTELYFKPKNGDGDGKSSNYVFKYDVLWELIYSAFYEKYRIDLSVDEPMHFEKFQMLLNGIKDTKLNDVLECWGKNLSKASKEEKKYCAKIKKQYPLGLSKGNESLTQRNARMKSYVKRRKGEAMNGK